ncbi:MAG: asparagine synthase-related protein [Candidatus Caldatribacteriaceae bacterium]
MEKELTKLIFAGHANSFQRVDQMTSAFAIDVRMPFVNSIVFSCACTCLWSGKFSVSRIQTIGKWILREAFENDLPDEIVWRQKQKFF